MIGWRVVNFLKFFVLVLELYLVYLFFIIVVFVVFVCVCVVVCIGDYSLNCCFWYCVFILYWRRFCGGLGDFRLLLIVIGGCLVVCFMMCCCVSVGCVDGYWIGNCWSYGCYGCYGYW